MYNLVYVTYNLDHVMYNLDHVMHNLDYVMCNLHCVMYNLDYVMYNQSLARNMDNMRFVFKDPVLSRREQNTTSIIQIIG